MTLHEVVVESRHTSCACGAAEDQPCTCPSGVHYSRVAHARRAGFISAEDFASAIHDGGIVGGMSVLLDPGEVTP